MEAYVRLNLTAKRNVLPKHHVLVLCDKTPPAEDARPNRRCIPAWAQDYALYLLDIEGDIAAWYSGSVRIYGLSRGEDALGQPVSILYPQRRGASVGWGARAERRQKVMSARAGRLKKTAQDSGQIRSRWPLGMNVGALQGFARVVRDFSEHHERDEKLHRQRARHTLWPGAIDHCRYRFG